MRTTKSLIAIALLSIGLILPGSLDGQQAFAADKRGDSAMALRRANFRVVGASCAVCLREAERLLRENAGVVSSAVSFKSPYKAVVIYYPQKVSLQNILSKLHQHSYSFADVEDKAVATVPPVLLGSEDSSQPARSDSLDLPKPQSAMP